jgi:hypothetical protein
MKRPTKQKDGRYLRNIGPAKGQQKFYLGRDEGEALLRSVQIEKLWGWRKQNCIDLGEAPSWDELSVSVGKAVASGDKSVVLNVDAPPELAVGLISGIREIIPHLEVRLSNQHAQSEGEEFFRTEATKLRDLASHFTLVEGNQTMAEAIVAYIASVEERYRLSNGLVSEWGQGKIRQIKYLQKHAPALRIADLDLEEIEGIILLIANRPPRTRDDKPISHSWAKATIKEFRQFIRWLHKSKDFIWRKPVDYEVEPTKIRVSDEERVSLNPYVETYPKSELVTLWQYATPWERCLMTLALNCGFGMAEIGTLRKEEFFPQQPHPFADQLNLQDMDDASWIRRNRAKTLSYGEWFLWSETIAAINWINEHRPNSDLPYIVVTQKGRPLKDEGKRNSRIANIWASLTKRIQKDDKGFTKRSFNKLRKTSSNMIRHEWDDAIADLFLAHGSPPVNHKHLHHYTNPRFAKLHEAVIWLRAELQAVFASVDEPFLEREKKGGANISLGRIQKIHELHDKGMPFDLIAKKVNVSKETVRRRLLQR